MGGPPRGPPPRGPPPRGPWPASFVFFDLRRADGVPSTPLPAQDRLLVALHRVVRRREAHPLEVREARAAVRPRAVRHRAVMTQR